MEDENIVGVADAVLRYLATMPGAVDTVEGVARWGLLGPRSADSIEVVQKSLDYLVETGRLQRAIDSQGCATYRRSLRS